jgi:hypothetical protein
VDIALTAAQRPFWTFLYNPFFKNRTLNQFKYLAKGGVRKGTLFQEMMAFAPKS